VASLKKSARPFFLPSFFKVKLLEKKKQEKKRRVGFYKKKGQSSLLLPKNRVA
jgi:hypothetical protein